MSQPLKKYVGFDNCVEEWRELARIYPDIIQVRIANVPLLHRLYILREETDGVVNVKYYTYGNCTPDKDFRRSFDHSGMEYELYTQEFDYIKDTVEKKLQPLKLNGSKGKETNGFTDFAFLLTKKK